MRFSVLFLFLFLALPAPALAYIGPGAGLTLMGSFFTLLAGIFIALFAIVFWPVRRFLKKRREKTAADAAGQKADGPEQL